MVFLTSYDVSIADTPFAIGSRERRKKGAAKRRKTVDMRL